MRLVIDTNILVSALIAPTGTPATILDAWLDGRFVLLICLEQLREIHATLQKPHVAQLIKPHRAGRLINQIRRLAEEIPPPLPHVDRSPDPYDNFLLALAQAGRADYLITGDKQGLLSLRHHQRTRIVSAKEFVALQPDTR